MIFAKNFASNDEKKKYLEHQTLCRRFVWTIVPANQRTSVLYCKLTDFKCYFNFALRT